MGRHYILESSGASKIFKESALKCLEELGPLESRLDQCMYGGPARKPTRIATTWLEASCLQINCDGGHSHEQSLGLMDGGVFATRRLQT